MSITLHDYQNSALELKINALIVKADEEFNNEINGQIIYAIDSNVIDLYTKPAASAQAKYKKIAIGTGETFPGESKELKQQITREIGVYLFTALTAKGTPLITLPHSRNEISKYLFLLLNQIEKGANKVQTTIKAAINKSEQLKSDIYGEQKLTIDEIATEISKIINAIYSESSPYVQYSRLIQLLNNKAMVDSHIYAEQWCPYDEEHKELKKLLSDEYAIKEKIKLAEYKSQWFIILNSLINRTINFSEEDLNRYSWILAKLEYINEKLPKNQRLVFITNTSVIIDAAQAKGTEFGDVYVRRPKQFLSKMYDQLFSSMPDKKQADINSKPNTIGQLVQLFLTDLNCKGQCTLQELRHVQEQHRKQKYNISRDNKFTSQLLHEWTEFNKFYGLNQLSAEKSTVTAQYPEFNNQSELLDYMNSLSSQIDQQVNNAWERFYEVGTSASYFALGAEHQLTRLPPPVIFARFENANEFLINIILKKKPVDYKKLHNFELALKKDCDKNSNNYKYLHNVTYSVLFSASGHNTVANQLAKRALKFIGIEQNKIESERDTTISSGREAHFLIAYNTRIIAKSASDLNDAFAHLALAQQYLKEGAQRYGYDFEKLGLRFEAEKLSLHLCCHLFKHYCNDVNHSEFQKISIWPLPEYGRQSNMIMQSIINSIKYDKKHLKKFDNDYSQFNAIAGFSSACDFLTASLLDESLLDENSKQRCFLCFELSYNIIKDFHLSISPLSQCMYYYAKALAANTDIERKSYKQEALKLRIHNNSQAKYERARIKHLRRTIGLLNSR